jgi:hypothetical protein
LFFASEPKPARRPLPNAVFTLLQPRFHIPFPEAILMFLARRLLILVGLFFFFSISASAQGLNLFGGFSYEHLDVSPGRNLGGVELEPEFKLASWFGAVADFDAHFGLPSAPDARTIHFMVGPQISFPGRISPFVHVLAGVGHVAVNGISDNSFAGAFGGGLDLRVAPLISWRAIQVDDLVTNHFGGVQHNARVSTGLVFRF